MLLDIIIFLIPLVTGYIMSYICPINKNKAGKTVPATPPSWIFGVVWSILYVLIGLAWVQLRKQKYQITVDILFILLIISLNSWIFIYSCQKQKKNALYILFISFIISLGTWGYSIGTNQMFYLTPLVGWLFFAVLLNFTEVNNLT